MVDVLGTRLGRYDIRERIGKGGMAAVYKAWDTNLDRWVAVKVLHDYLAEESDLKERFGREAKVVASLNHPNIVQVYDFDVIERDGNSLYYMVMAYIPGRSLKSVMDERHDAGQRLSLKEIDNVMQGVCSALTYAHAQGMIHRDVTPGNILFNEQGQAVLADFGIARMISGVRLTQTGMTSGTPMYMPPEQGVGSGGDHRSDIYSLGVILYEMLTGEAPYSGDSAVAIILKHINEPVPSLLGKNMDVPPAMETVIYTALAKDPADRYQSVQQMLTAYQQARSAVRETISKEEGRTVMLPGVSPVRRVPRAAIIGVGAVVLILLAAGLAYSQLTQARPTSSGAVVPTENVAAMALRNPPTLPVRATRVSGLAPSMANGPLIFTDDFRPDRTEMVWPTTTDDPQVYRNIEQNTYHIRLSVPNTALPSIFDEEHQYGARFEYEAELTLSEKSQKDSAAGIVFRYRDTDNYYVYAINGSGQVSIWARSNGTWIDLRQLPVPWTPADGALPAGKLNRLKLIDNGDELRGYVNDQLAVDVTAKPLFVSGAIGIYTATPSSTKIPDPLAEVTVSRFSTAYYLPPTPTSATPSGKS